MNRSPKTAIAIAVSLLMLFACEHWPVPPASIRVENGPAFIMSGKGKLATFTVYGPSNASRIANPFYRSAIIWELECRHGILTGAGIEGLRLVYGKMPDACHQTVPVPSQSAPHLASGEIYYFDVWSSLAGGLGGNFYVEKSGAVLPVDVDNCFTMDSGRWIRVNCKTQERFVEPTEIETFVQGHQRKCAFRPSATSGPSLCE